MNGNKFAMMLDDKFKITERNSSIKREVSAGIGTFLIAVCTILVNTNLINSYYGNVAGAYLAMTIVCIVGTFLYGFLANMPLINSTSVIMTSLVLTFLSANDGLSYANMMFITFISAVLYLIVLVTPIKKFFLDSIPGNVMKAMPIGIALYVLVYSVQKCGLVTSGFELSKISGLDTLDVLYFFIMICALVVFGIYVAIKRTNPLSSTYYMMIAAMWALGIIFYMEYFVGGQTATTLVYERVNLVVATDGANPYNIVLGISSLNVLSFLKDGMDFSAYTQAGGNIIKLMISSVVTFVLMSLYLNEGCTDMAMIVADSDDCDKKVKTKIGIISAITNIAAPIFGATPSNVSAESVVMNEDGARTGLSSVVAGMGFVISAFSFVFYAITATSTNGVGMWINDSETKLLAYVQDGFAFAALIMVIASAIVLKGVKKVNFADKTENLIVFATAMTICFTSNVIYGVCLGCVLSLVTKALSGKHKEISIMNIILTVVLIIYSVCMINSEYGFVTAVSNMMPM